MNRIMLLGRLTKDPEIRYTPSGACVAQFTLAVDRPYTKDGSREADFIPCVTWGKTSETIGNYVHKGQRLLVEGRLQIRSYDGKDGQKRWVTEVIANSVQFLDYSKGSDKPAKSAPKKQGFESFGQEVPYGGEEIPF